MLLLLVFISLLLLITTSYASLIYHPIVEAKTVNTPQVRRKFVKCCLLSQGLGRFSQSSIFNIKGAGIHWQLWGWVLWWPDVSERSNILRKFQRRLGDLCRVPRGRQGHRLIHEWTNEQIWYDQSSGQFTFVIEICSVVSTK